MVFQKVHIILKEDVFYAIFAYMFNGGSKFFKVYQNLVTTSPSFVFFT
jgi:hypothetical protein